MINSPFSRVVELLENLTITLGLLTRTYKMMSVMKEKLAKVKEKIKNDMPKTRKGKIIAIVCACVIPVALGVVGGVVFTKFFVAKKADYSNVDADALTINMDNVLAKYDDLVKSGTPIEEGLASYEIVNLAYYNYSNYENSRSFTIGSAVAAIVNQSIRGCSIREGNRYFEESLSKSNMVGVAARMEQKEDGSVFLYRGEAVDSTTASWNDVHYEYSHDEFVNDFGKTPSTPLIYIISKKTVLADSEKIEKTDEGYTISLSLSKNSNGAIKGVANYIKQMKSISNLADYPAFDEVDLVFHIDNDLVIKQMDVHESYYALKEANLGADTTGDLSVYYEVDGGFKIPSLNEPIIYPEKEGE